MTDKNEYDPVGELFRLRLENHRMPIDDHGWGEIERRLGKRKKKAAVWLWSAATVAAAIALLLIIRKPAAEETPVMAVAQQETLKEQKTANDESGSNPVRDINSQNPVTDSSPADSAERTNDATSHVMPSGVQTEYNDALAEDWIADTDDEPNPPTEENHPIVAQAEKEIPQLDISLVEDRPDDEENAKKSKKWLFAAAFGTGGSTNAFRDALDNSSPAYTDMSSGLFGSNDYAAVMSESIRSFNNMSKNDFTNIHHRIPLSFGITARKSLGKNGGVESGLVYTYLSSRFEWNGYDVHQSLHYVGIPVNMTVYLGDAKSNWRFYLSGGFTLEKGLRAKYIQEATWGNMIRTTTVKSSIDGVQWSLNGALGVNYRFDKGFGFYFEPRVGYSFDCNQPVSVRTEKPVFFGINMGVNYELKIRN